MKRLVLALLLALFVYTPRADAQLYQLIYDARTGNLTVDSLEPSTTLMSVSLISPTNQLNPANLNHFLPEQAPVPPRTDSLRVRGIIPVTPAEAIQIDPATAPFIDGTRWDMGNLLPAGMTELELNLSLFAPRANPFDITPGFPMQVIYVPEPTSLALLSLGGLALMRRRRSRK